MENSKEEQWNNPQPVRQENKKIVAGVLAILLGSLGVHKFILGYTTEGIIQLVISVITCGIGSIIGLIEGIIYLTKSDEEFYQTYQVNKKGWF
ncbi:TM2 domain-containing membrane protein YozV [Flavobacterium micromati]|jgi:TM2 domain-containing membrane protein YozV|uniref:TM2 domain-containing membrane protein YozV n=1 Tax=Flavobacterium micromati TaxID=229205 RepID=A0A1M5LGQ7_9FLAO|nr:TM2 domain-containing protein [Flavobacterium micromati]SHG63543.1 TM2 domain-containing membrane protein YozV [Flavobacterium micromati]